MMNYVILIEDDDGLDFYGPFRKYPEELLDRLEAHGLGLLAVRELQHAGRLSWRITQEAAR